MTAAATRGVVKRLGMGLPFRSMGWVKGDDDEGEEGEEEEEYYPGDEEDRARVEWEADNNGRPDCWSDVPSPPLFCHGQCGQ